MRWLRWPISRRRRRLELLDADAQLAKAAKDRHVAERALAAAVRARDEARPLGEWAREANRTNRFDLRLEAAYRTRFSRGGRPG